MVVLQVRSLWSVFDGMLSAIKEEQKVVDCVVNGEVDQHTLDGTDLVLKIPQTLLERIEQLPQHVSGGWGGLFTMQLTSCCIGLQ